MILTFVARSYVAEQRELLLQFRAAAGASARYALPRSAWLSLGTVSSAFWGLLDQAAAVGLTILAAKPLLGPLRTEHRASVVLDAHRDPSVGLLVGPRVLLDDRELELSSLGVLGDPAHGIFHVSEEAAGVQELIVARLDQLLEPRTASALGGSSFVADPVRGRATLPDRLRAAAASEDQHHLSRPISSTARLR